MIRWPPPRNLLSKFIAVRQEESRIASGWAVEAPGPVLLAGDKDSLCG
jgi:hypothetical protein